MDTLEQPGITEVLAIIDKQLLVLHKRELVSSAEVTDLLLDVRSLLVEPAASAS